MSHNDDPRPTYARKQLLAFVERVERLREEIKELNSDVSDVYGEAKANGFDVPALKRVIAHRARDPEKAKEQDAIFETYLSAIEGEELTGTQNATRARARPKSKPAPVVTPSHGDRTRKADAASQVPTPDGASATNSGSFTAAASETAARSPNLSKGEGREPDTQALAPSGGTGDARGTAAATDIRESEPVGQMAPIRGGRADADGDTALHAGSPPLSSDPLTIPAALRREPNDRVWG